MTSFLGIGFTAPWLLLGLLALPVLWIILRAVPPAPLRRLFPGVTLLLGLKDDDSVTDRTPWWLLLLRTIAAAAIILGLAGPVLNPQTESTFEDNPVLVVLDGSWAGASDWQRVRAAAVAELETVAQARNPAALINLSNPGEIVFQSPAIAVERLAALEPNPWQPTEATLKAVSDALATFSSFDTLWIGDGLDYPGRSELLSILGERGSVRVMEADAGTVALRPVREEDGTVILSATRRDVGSDQAFDVLVEGRDPVGNASTLARVALGFEAGANEATAELELPDEVLDRVTHFRIEGLRSAGGVSLVAEDLQRREIALIAARGDREALQLLSPLHYVEQALTGRAALLDLPLSDALPANPDAIVLADVAVLSTQEEADLLEWIETGGTLIRFAGPRVAASRVSRETQDPLMPVRLRAGGRTVGGAMSWGQPKALAPFADTSPFFGLELPPDVVISAQVLAQPDPNLSERAIAQLTDGTPVVTRKTLGRGQVVLFHVTANAEWSSLPLSGLFLGMLDRLLGISTDVSPAAAEGAWQAVRALDGYGNFTSVDQLPAIADPIFASASFGPGFPPGLYQNGDLSEARNVIGSDSQLIQAQWPATVQLLALDRPAPQALAGVLLASALILLIMDIVASLVLSGKLMPQRLVGVLLMGAGLLFTEASSAQETDDALAVAVASELRLAHVLTGDATVDEVAQAGLRGLSNALFFRTSVEPGDPVGVNLETDDLALFQILYWPVITEQPRPSAEAYVRLNAYLRSGGMILFDTRDADLAGFGTASAEGRKLRQLAAPLDIPQLEPVPNDHVLTRTFYLLQDFPGRHARGEIWVEAAPPDAESVEGMPFRNLNDGVTPVVIGGNDWASAWAINAQGGALLPVGRGFAGERQRELAYRFGINLVMYVLTGNYKSDQVHVPALLDRLGQ